MGTLLMKTVYFWINEFKRGRTCTEDEARSGRPVEVTTLDIVEKIHGMIMEDRRMKVREIAEAVGISTERVHNILHEKLHVKKLCARWVPRLLTLDQKRTRKDNAVFGDVKAQSAGLLASIHDCGRNLDPPLHS